MVTEIKTKTVNKNIKTLNKTVTTTEHIEHIRLALQGYNYGNGAIVQVDYRRRETQATLIQSVGK